MSGLWNDTAPTYGNDSVWEDEDKYRGQAAAITIGTVEAVVQGEESVINVGSPNDAVFNFKLPIGNDGEQGIQGVAGTVEIGEVSTGAVGTDVIITNVGSPSQAVLDITIPQGIQGVAGSKGWSPVFAVSSDGLRRVLKVSDWQGGEGTKPVVDVYMGVTDYTYVLADAVDIRGSQGIQGEKGDTGTAGATTYAALTDKTTVDLPATNTPLATALSGKQASLVSGTNIKTVNNVSLLGSGNVEQICGSQAFSVSRSAGSGTVTVGGTFGNLNDVYVDHANLNKTDGTFTIPVTGMYQFNVRALKTAGSQNLQIALRINGAITRHAVVIDGVSPYHSYLPVPLTHIAYFTAGQAIDVVVQLGTAHGDAEFTFSGYRVS